MSDTETLRQLQNLHATFFPYAWGKSSFCLALACLAPLACLRPPNPEAAAALKGLPPMPARPAAPGAAPKVDFHAWAPTPPMGWNSWDCLATTVTEEQAKAQAAFMGDKLKAHGWQYIVLDAQWFEPGAKSHEYRKDARGESIGGECQDRRQQPENACSVAVSWPPPGLADSGSRNRGHIAS